MKVKTYKTRSLQEGLDTIKRDLGNEALILSTRSVSTRAPFSLFKRPSWEITAAFDQSSLKPSPGEVRGADHGSEGNSLVHPALPVRRGSTPVAASGAAAATTIAQAPAPEAPKMTVRKDERMDELIGEIGELKKSMRSLSKAIPAKSDHGGLFAELVSQGIDYDLADHLIMTASRDKPAPSELRERVRRLLADQLLVGAAAELQAKARMVSVFVGPTGVGKTTTIAKIAGHASVRMKKKVALISTDMSRVGGHEQLNRFGDLLGIPAYGCADVSTLNDLIGSLDDADLVLIDTPGSSPSDLARLGKLETATSSAGAKVHLVISATTRSEDITKIVSRFQRFGPKSVIFTKMDEADAKGPFVGDLLRNELAVTYITNGQHVPEDLMIPRADDLARYVLPLEPAI